MKTKPLIFKVLMALFLIEPLFKILYFKAVTHFDFSQILANVFSRNGIREIFDFWLIFPLAGLCLVKLRQWTYFIFIGLLGYIVFSIFTYERYTWPYYSQSPHFYHYVIVALSLITMVFFLSPLVRKPFFDRRLRWWEVKPRYTTHIPCKVTSTKVTFESFVLNISKSGAFLKDSPHFHAGQKVQLEFSYQGFSLSVPVRLVSHHVIAGEKGCGVEFMASSRAQRIVIFKMVQLLKVESYT